MRFFSGSVFREIPLIVLEFFSVLLVLGFLYGGFFGTSSGAGVGLEESWVLCMENAIFLLEKPRGKKFSFC